MEGYKDVRAYILTILISLYTTTMKQSNLTTRIFLDSGDPQETKQALDLLGFLDGQTTNPSLIAKNPQTAGKKFSKEELLAFYHGVVGDVSDLIPKGSVSIEVYSDANTSAEEMLEQGRQFNTWIPNAHIKYPTTPEGLKAAELSVKEGMSVNMTLIFSQEQAAAVYAATKGAKKGQVFLSPFIGRLDDRGENGLDLIANIIKMYKTGDGHVEVLTASVRSVEHQVKAIELGSDIITSPLKILKEWKEKEFPISNFQFQKSNLTAIPYQEISLDKPWHEYNLKHELTDKGLEKFAADWNALIG
jgi:transaldolase